jgi:3-oxoadipate enol-lactonase
VLGTRSRAAITRLAEAMQSVKPLVDGVGAPVRVVPGGSSSPAPSRGQWRALQLLLARVATRTGVTGLALTTMDRFQDPQLFERVVSDRLALGEVLEVAGAVPADRLGEVDRIVGDTLAGGFESFGRRDTVVALDGVGLSAYSAGAGEETVVLVPACGMPAALAEPWIRFLARSRRVLTWESRGLFGGQAGGEHATHIGAQAADLFATMDHYRVGNAHVIGLCGGAAIALVAAAERPTRIQSLSVWHGAYGFGEQNPMTAHQRGLIELMKAAALSRAAAQAVHAAFCRAVLTSTPAEVAHHVLYPYASPELLYRYCRLNLGITETDIEPYLPGVQAPALVVTSNDDTVAHPDGSRRVAAGLRRGELRIEAHGDHISLFAADEPVLAVAEDFMRRYPVVRS